MKLCIFDGNKGFTLIELSIVLMISGLMAAAGFSAYSAYIKDRKAHDAYDRQKVLAASISNYVTKKSRLPCPADPLLPFTDPNAGRELPDIPPASLCTNLKLAADGTCVRFDGTAAPAGMGICKTSGRDTAVDPDALPDPILIGAVPYVSIKEGVGLASGAALSPGNDSTLPAPPPKECTVAAPGPLAAIPGIRENTEPSAAPTDPLPAGTATYCDIDNNGVLDAGVNLPGISASFADAALQSILDPYGFQMSYAVTGALTNASTAHNSYGAISVVTETGVTLVRPVSSAHYVIISHGDNHVGAYNMQGSMPFPCTVGNVTPEEDNCDGDGVFVSGLRSVNANLPASYYDDLVWTSVINISSLWDFVPNSADIFNLNIGNVGVGTTAPVEKLHVNGDLRAITARQSMICDPGGTNCWSPDNLAGDPAVTDSGGNPLGSLCDTAAYPPAAGKMRVVVGIKNGRTICSTNNPADPDYVDDGMGGNRFPDPDAVVPLVGTGNCASGQYVKGFLSSGAPICCDPSLPGSNPASCSFGP